MSLSIRSLPLLVEPTEPGAESADVDCDDEVTARHVDLPRALGELLALVSRTESLTSAAERDLYLIAGGPTAGYARRLRRISDLMVGAREVALRALEVGHALSAEVSRRA